MYQRIVVALDRSPFAERALPVAEALARRLRIPVDLVLVATPSTPAHAHDEYLDGVVRAAGPPFRRWSVLSALTAAPELVELGAGHALLCLASHARGTVGDYVLPSVAEEVVRTTEQPLLLVGPEAAATGFDPILVAVDGSAASEAGLPLAVQWAAALGASLWLAQVVPPEARVPAGADVEDAGYLHHLSAGLARPAAWEVLHGDAAPSLVAFAGSVGAGLIVVGTRGRSGMARLAFGSVAIDVIRDAPCPVLVHRPRAG